MSGRKSTAPALFSAPPAQTSPCLAVARDAQPRVPHAPLGHTGRFDPQREYGLNVKAKPRQKLSEGEVILCAVTHAVLEREGRGVPEVAAGVDVELVVDEPGGEIDELPPLQTRALTEPVRALDRDDATSAGGFATDQILQRRRHHQPGD